VVSYSGGWYAAVASLQPSVLRSSPPPTSMISSHCFELLASIHITLGEVGLFLASRNTTEQHVVSRERDLIEGEQGEPRVLDAEERADFTDLHIQLYQSSGFWR